MGNGQWVTESLNYRIAHHPSLIAHLSSLITHHSSPISSVRLNAKTLISGAQLIDPYSPDFFDGVQVGTTIHRPEYRVSLGSQ
jgi:hypothetical protein